MEGGCQSKTVYGHDPADMALRWVNDGATQIHVVDIDGARLGTSNNFESICKIAVETQVPLQVGGGIRDEGQIEKYLNAGIQRLVLGTRALREPEWAIDMAEKYPNVILLGLDSRVGMLATDGWLETTAIKLIKFAEDMTPYPFAGIVFTDIDKDGMLAGPNFIAKQQLLETVDVPVIASGGVTSADDIKQLATIGLSGCVIGRALYEGKLTFQDAIKAASSQSCSPVVNRQEPGVSAT